MTTQNECHCSCDQYQSLKVPVCGLLELNLNGTRPAPAPEKLCRERVDHDVDIYINGNLEASGDGLTPETAVKSYGDAVLALSRYDGCNLYNAHFHFADLADPEATYPDMFIRPGTYSTFGYLSLSGVSHETTRLGSCQARGSTIYVKDVCVGSLWSVGGWINPTGKIGCKPLTPAVNVFFAEEGGSISLDRADIYLFPGQYRSILYSEFGKIVSHDPVSFHTMGEAVAVNNFAIALCGGAIFLERPDFSDCTSVIGSKYNVIQLSSITTGGTAFPGTLAGTTASGGLYV